MILFLYHILSFMKCRLILDRVYLSLMILWCVFTMLIFLFIKRVWHEIFVFRFFHESVSPGSWISRCGHFEFLQKFAILCLSPMSLTPAISCSPLNETGDNLSPMKQLQRHQLASTSKWTKRKKSVHECKQQPISISTKKEKNSCLKFFFPFIAGVVDTGDQLLLSNISSALSNRPPKAPQVSLRGLDCALCTLHADASCTM